MYLGVSDKSGRELTARTWAVRSRPADICSYDSVISLKRSGRELGHEVNCDFNMVRTPASFSFNPFLHLSIPSPVPSVRSSVILVSDIAATTILRWRYFWVMWKCEPLRRRRVHTCIFFSNARKSQANPDIGHNGQAEILSSMLNLQKCHICSNGITGQVGRRIRKSSPFSLPLCRMTKSISPQDPFQARFIAINIARQKEVK